MGKVHLKVSGIDARESGQTDFEFNHQAACGYVRKEVTSNMDSVTCFYCLRSKEMEHYHKLNKTLTDSSGCY